MTVISAGESAGEVARLETPDSRRIVRVAVGENGRQIAAMVGHHDVRLWDLRRIRTRLAAMDLDLDLPPCPATDEPSPSDPSPPPTAAKDELWTTEPVLPGGDLTGVAGLWSGDVSGAVPDFWGALAGTGSELEIEAVSVDADQVFPGSKAGNAVVHRARKLVGAGGFSSHAGFAMSPARRYRAGVWVKSANADGSEQKFDLRFTTAQGAPLWPGYGKKRYFSRQGLVAIGEWQLFESPLVADPEAKWGTIGWGCVDDGGENAIVVAFPTVDELVEPQHLRSLGVAHERAGRYDEAAATFERAALMASKLDGPGRGGDLLRLAMCHHRLGRAEEAERALGTALSVVEAENDAEFVRVLPRFEPLVAALSQALRERLRKYLHATEAFLGARLRNVQNADERTAALWESWCTLEFVYLGRDASETLASFPIDADACADADVKSPAADVRWLLEQLEKETVLRVNCGGLDYESPTTDEKWSRDRFFVGGYRHFGDGEGGAKGPCTDDIEATADDPLYRTERWFTESPQQPPGYRIPLPPGRYTVTLHFAEVFYEKTGRRTFDVLLEGREVLASFQPAIRTASQHAFETEVRDGVLDLQFSHYLDCPQVAAIEIAPLGSP